MFAVWLLVPYSIVNVLRYPASAGGTLLAPCPLGMALAAPLSGLLSDRFSARSLSVPGLIVEAAGLFCTSRLTERSPYLVVAATLILIGLGLGTFTVANMKFVLAALPGAQQGVAAGMVSMMRTLGVVTGVTTAAEVYSVRDAAHRARLLSSGYGAGAWVERMSFVGGFRDTFAVSAAVCLLATLLSAIPVRSRSVLRRVQEGVANQISVSD
jgi:MFS family permease